VATGSFDSTVLVWDVGRAEKARLPERLTAAELEARWNDLAADGVKAYAALPRLADAAPQVLPDFADRLQPMTEPKELARLVADLDGRDFAVRRKAEDSLERLGALAEPELRKALDAKPSLESQKRLEELLRKAQGFASHPAEVQTLRAIEVLETIGTVEACRLLEKPAGGAPGARQTRAAKTALEHIRQAH